MWLNILIAVAVIVVLFVIVVSLRPGTFRVERSATVAAPAPIVFEHVNDLHKWQEWSPWARLDPAARTTFSGPPAGEGAGFAWAGNKHVGEGRMTLMESRPNELVQFKLEFFKPFVGTNTAEFTFKAQGNQTVVTWATFGNLNFITKAIGLFISCDKMMGGQFEAGLTNLKAVVKSANRA